MIARRLVIEGRVQGVGYRAWMLREARVLGLRGWVRNRPDGTVEATVASDTEAVDRLIALCHRGPPMAAVSVVRVEDAALPDNEGFEQR